MDANNYLYKQNNIYDSNIVSEYLINMSKNILNINTIITQLCYQNHKSYFKLGDKGDTIVDILFKHYYDEIKIDHIYKLLDCYKKIAIFDYKYRAWFSEIKKWLLKNYNQEIENNLANKYKICINPNITNNDIYKSCIFMCTPSINNINDAISFFCYNIFTTKLISYNVNINYKNNLNNLKQEDFINLISNIINCPYYNQKYDGSFNKTFISIYYNYLKIINKKTINNNLVQLIKLFTKIKNQIIVKYCMVLILELYGTNLTIDIINAMLEYNLIGIYGIYDSILSNFNELLNSAPVNCKKYKSYDKILYYCIYSKAISLNFIPNVDTLDCFIPQVTNIIPMYEEGLNNIIVDIITRYNIIPNKKILDKIICLQNVKLMNLILSHNIYPDITTFNTFIDTNDKLIASNSYPVTTMCNYINNFKLIVDIILKYIPLTVNMIVDIFPFYKISEIAKILTNSQIQILCNYYYSEYAGLKPTLFNYYKYSIYSIFANDRIRCSKESKLSYKKQIIVSHMLEGPINKTSQLSEFNINTSMISYKNLHPIYVDLYGLRGPKGAQGHDGNYNDCNCEKCCKYLKYNIIFNKKYSYGEINITYKKEVDLAKYNFLKYYKKCIKHNLI